MRAQRLGIPESCDTLPEGYHYGAHRSGQGWSGHYVIRESDGASCTGYLRPDLSEEPTADDIDAAIEAEAEAEVQS